MFTGYSTWWVHGHWKSIGKICWMDVWDSLQIQLPSPNPPDEQKLEPILEAESQPPAKENNKKKGHTTKKYHN